MTTTLDRVKTELQTFVHGGAFVPLWRAVMDATEEVDHASDLSDADREWFDQVYDLVYMGGEGAVTADERSVGILGSDELRRALLEKGLNSISARPA
ncbi:MAG TPA: hypothetical protein VF962_03815 [Gemmatimonadaceae bacterium]